MRVEYDVSGYSGGEPHREAIMEPQPLPSEWAMRAYRMALLGSRERRRALMAERGLRPAYGLGWDERKRRWVLPVRDEAGTLINVRYRGTRGVPRKPRHVGGRPLPLYPRVPDGDEWVLTAGEWDALCVLQAGLPGVSGSSSGCLWLDEWNPLARGKRISVLYDVGEEDAADTTVERLRCIGAQAWPVRLQGPDKFDPCDFLMMFGEAELRRFINEARP